MSSTTTRPRASLAKQFANFTNSTAGLDLTLRFLHSIAIIVSETGKDKEIVAMANIANMQINLGRRYLRFFGFLDCFHNVYDLIARPSALGTATTVLDLVEASCLGMYLFLENSTMLHDMQMRPVSWYNSILVEANKFWFYAICASILRTLVLLFWAPSQTTTRRSQNTGKGKKQQAVQKQAPNNVTRPPATQLLRKLVVDGIDLMLPASFIGWVLLSDLTIGSGMLISTILAWPDLWSKYQ